jgi:hypothetical protein
MIVTDELTVEATEKESGFVYVSRFRTVAQFATVRNRENKGVKITPALFPFTAAHEFAAGDRGAEFVVAFCRGCADR